VFDPAGTLGLAAGISVHARSGMSGFVVANYDFGPASQHYLCGNTDVPLQADRVFAGA
jgi:hypothetical protein